MAQYRTRHTIHGSRGRQHPAPSARTAKETVTVTISGLAAADHFASIEDKLTKAGFYTGLALAQLRALVGPEPVLDAYVMVDLEVDMESGLNTDVVVTLLTATRLLTWFGLEGKESAAQDVDMAALVALEEGAAAPQRAVLRSQTRVVPLRHVIDVRVQIAVSDPASRAEDTVADWTRVDVLTPELADVFMVGQTCEDCDCGTSSHEGELHHASITLLEDGSENPDAATSELLRFTGALSYQLGQL